MKHVLIRYLKEEPEENETGNHTGDRTTAAAAVEGL